MDNVLHNVITDRPTDGRINDTFEYRQYSGSHLIKGVLEIEVKMT